MKVNAWKNVNVECEVEVGLEDCINEMLGMAEKEDSPRLKLMAIDGATKVLEKIEPDMVIGRMPLHTNAVGVLRNRLKVWMTWLIEQERSDDCK